MGYFLHEQDQDRTSKHWWGPIHDLDDAEKYALGITQQQSRLGDKLVSVVLGDIGETGRIVSEFYFGRKSDWIYDPRMNIPDTTDGESPRTDR